MGLFSTSDMALLNEAALKSKSMATASAPKQSKKISTKSISGELERISALVREYFKDSEAILITTEDALHDYVTKCIEVGFAGIDTETTGLDRVNDTVVGASLYYPDGKECYIPMKHMSPIFGAPYKNQLTYEQVAKEFQRLVDEKVKLIFANADYDIGMIYKDLHVDTAPAAFYDCIIAWRCIKENEPDNKLKTLYQKYVKHGEGHPMHFKDFFPPELFPYCKPDVAAPYAANDARITYELFRWQLPYIQKNNPKCQKRNLESISDLIFGLEFPLIPVCHRMHERGVYLEQSAVDMLAPKYAELQAQSNKELQDMVAELLNDPQYHTKVKCPFKSVSEFLPNSNDHVGWLLYDYMGIPAPKKRATNKETISTFNLPICYKILECRSYTTLISTFIKKLPNIANNTPDHRIHCTFNSIGADTGRMSSKDPN